MILQVGLLALTTAQRLGELILSQRNIRRLKAKGGYEAGAGHYPWLIAVHVAWLAGLWLLAWSRPLNLPLAALYLTLQAGRVWVIASLGERWTTRIIVLPGAPLVRRGPYRFLAHPNYVIVAGEVLVLPLAFGLWAYALAFSALNAIALWVRIRAEDKALKSSSN
ncbi:MAG: isoprenylcysteine carboxyl methyltransferase family protein [Caulobacterales bacterium]